MIENKQQKKKAKKLDEHINQCFYFELTPLTRDVTCSKL